MKLGKILMPLFIAKSIIFKQNKWVINKKAPTKSLDKIKTMGSLGLLNHKIKLYLIHF